ncbi:MAG TPA: C-GCAxxG-C-C family protein, partial [Deltaproteobacteria bacterium]|nr:C-GCAxxG-C-C family protein [Deltaproteobacteria bacterium]
MAGKKEDMALRSATGLEGGLVARGSTCGVVTGGSLGLALTRIDEIDAEGEVARRRIMEEVRDYVHWFRDSFG